MADMAMHIGNPWVVSMNGVDDNTIRFLASTAVPFSTHAFRTNFSYIHCSAPGGRAEH